MGEHYVVIAFGIMNPPAPPEISEDSWRDLPSSLVRQQKALADADRAPWFARLTWRGLIGFKVGEDTFELEEAYEATPEWLGFRVAHFQDDYEAMPLAEALARQDNARIAWDLFRGIVLEQTGIDLPAGQLIISSDHT